ncbi:MAG: hypothetical protein Q8M54_03245 [Desulfobaccales bacterium]|nr:hypothetical protein [Desulfobaccales bacterium]
MRKFGNVLGIMGILCLIFAVPAWAQQAMPDPGKGGGMMGGRGGQMYDPKTVETISGEVVRVDQMAGMAAGVHLLLKTDKETLTVVVGPAAYLDQQKMKIAAGDKLEVRGSRVTRRQGPVIVAAELKKGGQVLKLRDNQGLPLWPPQGPGR